MNQLGRPSNGVTHRCEDTARHPQTLLGQMPSLMLVTTAEQACTHKHTRTHAHTHTLLSTEW